MASIPKEEPNNIKGYTELFLELILKHNIQNGSLDIALKTIPKDVLAYIIIKHVFNDEVLNVEDIQSIFNFIKIYLGESGVEKLIQYYNTGEQKDLKNELDEKIAALFSLIKVIINIVVENTVITEEIKANTRVYSETIILLQISKLINKIVDYLSEESNENNKYYVISLLVYCMSEKLKGNPWIIVNGRRTTAVKELKPGDPNLNRFTVTARLSKNGGKKSKKTRKSRPKSKNIYLNK